MLRCEEGQCDDMCAGLGQCVASHTSINYFKSLLQKKARFVARKEDDAKRSEDETVCLCFAYRMRNASNRPALTRFTDMEKRVFFAEIYAMGLLSILCTITI